MPLMKPFDSAVETIELDITGARKTLESPIFMSDVKMYFSDGLPGIVWFSYSKFKLPR